MRASIKGRDFRDSYLTVMVIHVQTTGACFSWCLGSLLGLRTMLELPKYLLRAAIHFHKYHCLCVSKKSEVGGLKQDASRARGPWSLLLESLIPWGEEGNLLPGANFQWQRPSGRRVGVETNYNHKKILASQESL